MTKRLFFPALHSMLDDFRSFDEAFGSLYNNDEVRKLSHYNIEEDDKSYTIEMDMPGVRKEDLEDIELLKQTPGAALGSSRKKLPPVTDPLFKKILSTIKKHDIGYILVNGGNDSMDTCNVLDKFFKKDEK